MDASAGGMGGRTQEANQGHETPGPSDYIPETHDSFGRGGLTFTIKGREGMGCACVPRPSPRAPHPRPVAAGFSFPTRPRAPTGAPTPPPRPPPGCRAWTRRHRAARPPRARELSPPGAAAPSTQSGLALPSAWGTEAGASFSEQTQEPSQHAWPWALHAQVWQPLPAGAEPPGGVDGHALQEHA